MASRRRQLLLFLVLVLPLRALPAERSSNVVLLEAVGNPVDVEALRASLGDWLHSLELELHQVSVLPPASEPAFARVRVVWSDETCVVEVFSQTGELRRRKALPRGGPPLLVSESAALVAQAAVQELEIEEREKPPPPPPPSPVVEVQGTPPQNPPPFGLRVAAWFQGRSYDSSSPVLFGGGGQVSASFGEGPWHPGVALLVAYQGPVTRQAETVELQIQLQTLLFRLLPTLRHRFGPVELELGLGGGLDLLIASTTSSTVPGARLRPNRVDPAPFFTAGLGVSLALTPATAIFLRAMVDLDPARRRYVSSFAGEREYLLVPWVARPALQLGFSFDVMSRAEGSP